MTGQLRTALQTRADDLETWDVDVPTIVAAGDRRLRRRRTALVGGLAGVLIVAGAAVALTARGDHRSPQPAEENAKPLTYAVGSVIHTGVGQIDAGVRVESIVPVVGGFVFSGPDRTVYLEMGGTTHALGHLAALSSPLHASDDGLVAAWWDGRLIQTWPGYRSDGNDQVAVDDKTNSFGVARSWPSDDPPRVEALSDGHLWWWTGRRHMIGEVRPTPTTAGWPDTNPSGSGTVVDAAGDHVLVRLDQGMAVTDANLLPWPVAAQKGWKPGGDLAGLTPQVSNVSTGDLAPDARHWFTEDHDQFAVFDSATGARQDLPHPGFAFAAPYEWLGNDTIAAVAWRRITQDPEITLLTCRVSTSACQVSAPDIGRLSEVTIPTGAGAG